MVLIDSDPNRVITERLFLVPLSLELVSLLQTDIHQAAARLGAAVPEDWLSPDLRDYLPLYHQIVEKDPEAAVWGIWTMVCRDAPRIVGAIGFKGRPDSRGTIYIVYGVRAEHQGKGYATEAARGLIAWAFIQPGVRRVTADCLAGNFASIRVLEKAGMRRLGPRSDGLIAWEQTRG
ncbi:MAG: N-acetyltransferase [Chloroflexi bacterium]|nr:MAG: N-acetyltransferase [Chloroflexota bacterium]